MKIVLTVMSGATMTITAPMRITRFAFRNMFVKSSSFSNHLYNAPSIALYDCCVFFGNIFAFCRSLPGGLILNISYGIRGNWWFNHFDWIRCTKQRTIITQICSRNRIVPLWLFWVLTIFHEFQRIKDYFRRCHEA